PFAPDQVDEPFRRQRLVRVQQQDREKRALAATVDRDRGPVVDYLERSEYAELEHRNLLLTPPRRHRKSAPPIEGRGASRVDSGLRGRRRDKEHLHDSVPIIRSGNNASLTPTGGERILPQRR